MTDVIRLKRAAPLERGDLRILVLNMVKKPMHGYQIMCRFKEYSHGDYIPSTGALYPQLRSLEEEGLIRQEDTDGRKNYVITKVGEEYINKNDKLVKQTMKRFTEFLDESDVGVLIERMRSIAKILMDGGAKALESGKGGDSKKIEKSKEILAKAESDLKEVWE